MKKLTLAALLLAFLFGSVEFISAAPASEVVFHWKVLRGSPRSPKPLETAEHAKEWLLGKGKGDLTLVTSGQDATKTVVLLEQKGAEALRTVRIKPPNQISEDGGATWQTGEFRNIVFGATPVVVFKGPLSIEWGNYLGGTAYYPIGLNSEWVPVLQGACGNLFLWHRPRPQATPVRGVVVRSTPTPSPSPPPSVVALGPPPDTSGRAYQKPDRVQETRSVHTVASIGQVPIPKFPEVKVLNSGNNTLMPELLNNIINNNANINTNNINAIMQQLQQLVVPIGIGN